MRNFHRDDDLLRLVIQDILYINLNWYPSGSVGGSQEYHSCQQIPQSAVRCRSYHTIFPSARYLHHNRPPRIRERADRYPGSVLSCLPSV